MDKIKTYQDFKKYTPKQLFEYSDREDLTDEQSDLFVSFCKRAINEYGDGNGHLLTENDKTLEQYIILLKNKGE